MACCVLSAPDFGSATAADRPFRRIGRSSTPRRKCESPFPPSFASISPNSAIGLPNAVALLRIFRSRRKDVFRAAEAIGAQAEAADVQRVERDDVPAADFMQQVFLRNRRVLEKDRHGRTALDAHLFFFRAGGESRRAALDDKAGEFLAIHFREHDEHVREPAVRDPHFLPVQNPVFSVGRQHGARARGERIRTGLRLGQAIAGKFFAGGDARQISLLLFFRAEINDRDRADAGVAAVRNGEGSIAGEFFGQERRGNFVQRRAAVFFRNRSAEQAQLRRLFSAFAASALLCAARARGYSEQLPWRQTLRPSGRSAAGRPSDPLE